VAVHSILPPALTDAVADVLDGAGIAHVAHGDRDHVAAAVAAVNDPAARAVIGPFRSRAVAEAIDVTAPAGLPLFAPVATWAGVTRDDESGCDDSPVIVLAGLVGEPENERVRALAPKPVIAFDPVDPPVYFQAYAP
jgi:hypothetical protein